jgi:hypothetical protein
MTPQSLVDEFGRLDPSDPRRLGIATLISHEFNHGPSLAATLAQWAAKDRKLAEEEWSRILQVIPATRISLTPNSDFPATVREAARLSLMHGGREDRTARFHTFDTGHDFIYFDTACVKAMRGHDESDSLVEQENAQVAIECLAHKDGGFSNQLIFNLIGPERFEARVRLLLDKTKQVAKLYEFGSSFDERIRSLLSNLVAAGLPNPLSPPSLATLQLLATQCWELNALSYFLSRGTGGNAGPGQSQWHALLVRHAARTLSIDVSSVSQPYYATFVKPAMQHGGAIGTRGLFRTTASRQFELAVFEPGDVQRLQKAARGILKGTAMIRFGYFKAMVCERQLRPKSAECRFLSEAAVLGSFDNEGTDELIAKEYLRRSTGWPICSF